MENLNRTEQDHWLQKSLGELGPGEWQPDAEQAYDRFVARTRQESKPLALFRPAYGLAAVAVCAAIFSIPGTRAVAQQLWQWIAVRSIEMVGADFDDLADDAQPLEVRLLSEPAVPIQVGTIDEAGLQAGFTPRLPTPDVLSADAHLSILKPMLFGARIDLPSLNKALRNVGVEDRLPEHWDDRELRLQVGAIVSAEWDGLTLMQSLPPVLETPSGFDLGAFSTAVFIAAGLDKKEAESLGRSMAIAPSLMFGVGSETVSVKPINLRYGTATLIEDFGDKGLLERVTIVWSAPDRLYVLSGAVTPDRAIELASAVP